MQCSFSEDSREGRPHYTTENSLHNANLFPREFHYVYVVDYITQINSPEIIFLYVMILVPTVMMMKKNKDSKGLWGCCACAS